MKKKVLVGLTTITGDEWMDKIKEIDKLGIEEIALFPTCLELEQRKELYDRLKRTKLKKIPHIHIRDGFQQWEFDLLSDRYQAQVFNIHPEERCKHLLDDSNPYRSKIFIENLFGYDYQDYVDKCGGMCVDISHWEDYGVKQKYESYVGFEDYLAKQNIGCNHISGLLNKPFLEDYGGRMFEHYCTHRIKNLKELDYTVKYKDYLADIISIELENTLEEQLEAKQYLEKILKI